MKNLTYEAILENPELMNEVLRNARRERAEAIAPAVLSAMRALLGPATIALKGRSACTTTSA